MDYSSVKEFLGADWQKFLSAFKRIVDGKPTLLVSVNNYLSERSGKQLRPMVALLSSLVCGGATFFSTLNASAVEIMHCASLLHDDVADNSERRRSQVTVQKKFGRDVSILTGDFYLASTFLTLLEMGDTQYVKLYSKTMRTMCEGEIFQCQKSHSLDTTIEEYYFIIGCKTAYLFSTALRGGALSAGANEQVCNLFEQCGYEIGLAFQIKDDIFDYSPQIESGKPNGIDIAEGKITLPLLLSDGVEAKRDLIAKASSADQRAKSELIEFVNSSGGIENSQLRLEQHLCKALSLMSQFPKPRDERGLKALNYLQQITRSLSTRVL